MKKLFIILIWFICSDTYFGQQPTIRLDSLQSIVGDSVIITLHAENLANIGAVTIKISLDTTVLKWGRILSWDSQLDGALAGFINNQIILAWDGLSGLNLANGNLVELKLLYKGKSSPLVFDTTYTELANLEGNIIHVTFIDGSVSPLTDLEKLINPGIPKEYVLHQNYPNPFNPSTVITYELPISGHVTLKVYDVLGNEIKTLVNEMKETGKYTATFDASKLASGMYVYRLQAGEFVQARKMILLK